MHKNKAAFLNSFKFGSPFNTSNDISPWIHVSALNSYLCTEFVNEMNSRKKISLCFLRFMSGFYQINVSVSRLTEFNLEQNLHTSESFVFSVGSNFNHNVHQYSLDGNISAESRHAVLNDEICVRFFCMREQRRNAYRSRMRQS